MEISQKEVDTLKQTLEFFFPKTSSDILLKPTYKMAEGEAADPLIQGIAHAAEQVMASVLHEFDPSVPTRTQ